MAADGPNIEAVAFENAEEAWFWTMAILLAREDGADEAWRPDGPERPCDPEDVLSCVDSLYREGAITLAHARVIRRCGAGQQPPRAIAAQSYRLWHHALGLIEWRLRARGIVR